MLKKDVFLISLIIIESLFIITDTNSIIVLH